MADYYTYRSKVQTERRHKKMLIIVVLLVILLLIAAVFWWRLSLKKTEQTAAYAETELAEAATAEQAEEQNTEQTAAAPGPVRLFPAVDDAVWNTSESVEQTIDLEYLNTDYRMAALPMLGTVAGSYFNTVTFVGDSITSGLGIYDAGIKQATYAAYIGAGPNSFVNNVSMQNAVTKVTETPLETIAASAPDYVYIMLGTNTLVSQGNEDSFIAYYERLIQMLQEMLPGVKFYVQAIPAVQEWVKDGKPGLDNDRITVVNNLIANMALRNKCYFVNPCEVLNNNEGSQVDEYETKDGIHLQPSGYRAWSEYLATHTAWDRRSLYAGENPYYIFGS